MIDSWEIKVWLREKTIDFAIWLVKRVERCKNESLSWELHQLADQYARRPTGQWETGTPSGNGPICYPCATGAGKSSSSKNNTSK